MFIARNRFAVLDKATNTIQIRNLQNEITKKTTPPCATTDALFYAGTGMLLCRSEDKVKGGREGAEERRAGTKAREEEQGVEVEGRA